MNPNFESDNTANYLYPGITDTLICDVDFKSLNQTRDKHFINNMKKILNEFVQATDVDARATSIVELVEQFRHFKPADFEGYIWMLKFACRIILIKNIPLYLASVTSAVIDHIFTIPANSWHKCPEKIHLAAHRLLPDLQDDLNLVYVVRRIWVTNKFVFLVCLSMVWAALHRHAKIEVSRYRQHDLVKLLPILKNIKINDKGDNIFELYQFLQLFSLLQNMSILKKQFKTDDSDPEFQKIFQCSQDVFNHILNWLRDISVQIDIMSNKEKTFDSCHIIELLKVDILGLMENKLDLLQHNNY